MVQGGLVTYRRKEDAYCSGVSLAPLVALNSVNLLQSFFQGQASVGVVVDVKVEFQNGSTAETTTNTITVRPSFSSEIVTGMVMKADGQQLSHLYGRAGTLPNLEWTVTTSTALPNQVQVGIFKQGGTQIACETLENATSLFTQITPVNGPNGKIYTLTAESGSELFNLLSTQGAGRYEIRFSGAACSGGDWSSAQVALITLNPNQAFRLRFHYRDHLGSSTVSRAYTPEYQTGIAGAATFNLKMSALGNQFVTLYAQPEKATNFTPFGKPMGDVNEEPNPRYTDHEFDAESGLNYMKGRYQLANFAKFNRPDPMRDWDWEKPSSINLYQYVRNNPIMSWDPNGFDGAAAFYLEQDLKRILNNADKESAKKQFFENSTARAGGAMEGVGIITGGGALKSAGEFIFEKVTGVPALNPKELLNNVKDLWKSGKKFFKKSSAESTGLLDESKKIDKTFQNDPEPSDASTQAEEALEKGLNELQNIPNSKKPAVVIGASSNGTATMGSSSPGPNGCCAEVDAAKKLGGNPKDITFTKPIRPRTGQEIPVCSSCQELFDRIQFPKGTIFEGDK